MIEIKKSPTADTRTCDVTKVERQQLLDSSRQHIADVAKAMAFLSSKLFAAAAEHDYDKLLEPNEAALLKRAMCVLQEASEDLAADGHLSEQTIATINAVLLDK